MVTFTATVSPENASLGVAPGGMVQWKVDGVAVGAPVALAAGQAQLMTRSLTAGHRGVRAFYLGDANYTGSTSPTYVQTVRKVLPGVSPVLSAPASPITFGTKPITFSTTFSNPIAPAGSLMPGDVRFLIDGTALGIAPIDAARHRQLHGHLGPAPRQARDQGPVPGQRQLPAGHQPGHHDHDHPVTLHIPAGQDAPAVLTRTLGRPVQPPGDPPSDRPPA